MAALAAAATPTPTALTVPIKDGCAEVELTLGASSLVLLCGEILN